MRTGWRRLSGVVEPASGDFTAESMRVPRNERNPSVINELYDLARGLLEDIRAPEKKHKNMSAKRVSLLVLALAAATAVLWRHAVVGYVLAPSVDEVDGQIRSATLATEPRALALMGLGLVLLACACAWWRSRASRNAPRLRR